jgi:hypothetical protein
MVGRGGNVGENGGEEEVVDDQKEAGRLPAFTDVSGMERCRKPITVRERVFLNTF